MKSIKNSKSLENNNVFENKLDKLLELIYSDKKYENIKQIKKELYDICSHHNDRTDIVKYLYNAVITKTTSVKKKLNLLK